MPVSNPTDSVNLKTGDIQIGAVEIKDKDNDTRASVETRGSKNALATEIVDASGNQITQFVVDDDYPAGSGSNGSVTLTSANTAYAVPASAPTKKYVMVLYNNTSNNIYWGYENSNSNGIILESGEKVSIDLGANEQIYCYSATAGTTIVYTYKEVA